MERLRGIDANFLYMETPTAHMHTIKVAVVTPEPDAPYTIERVKSDLRDRLHLLPPLRRRIVDVPLGFHHPVWIEDPDFDLDQHVRAATLPPPGGQREMDAAISAIASVALTRDRPLWEIWVLEGFAGGRVPVVAKIHHALADGVAVATLLANVLDVGSGRLAPPEPATGWTPDLVPSPGRLLADACRDHVRQLARFPRLIGRTAHNVRAVVRQRRASQAPPPRPFLDTPTTPFNAALTARRTFVSTSLPFDDVKTVRRVFGVTVNDVLLALVADALRAELARRGALPRRSLLAEVPVATDAPGDVRLVGNRLSNIFTSLCTDVDDPIARLRAIHEVTDAAKEVQRVLGPDLYESWTQYAPPRPTARVMRWYSRHRIASRHRPAVNVIVSSVPGPRLPLAWPGGRLDAIYSVGPIIEGTGLNVTAWSYVDQLYVGVLTCPDLLADARTVTAGLHQALSTLLARIHQTDLRLTADDAVSRPTP